MSIQLFEYHPIIGYRFIPGLKLRLEHEGGGYLVRTNSAGFRSEHEYTKQKTPGKFRILLFGDSFTAGDAVSNKHRYGDVLETLLPPEANAEVYNFALPGTGTDQHYLVWREIAREFEHDLVIIAAQVENIRRVAARHRLSVTSEGEQVLLAKPYFELEADGTLDLRNVPVPKEPLNPEDLPEEDKDFVDQGGRLPWLRNIVNKLGVKDVVQKMSGYQPLPEYDSPTGREWQLMSAILKQWIAEIEKPVILMPVPLYQYVEETASPENYRKRFAELVESVESIEFVESADLTGSIGPLDSIDSTNSKNSLILHDPLDDYYAVPKAERRSLRFEKDIHPTPEHHKLLAKSLVKTLYRFFPARAEGFSSIGVGE
ncbi:MAG TPA: SGNH/GDSL hydrolase family protein [Pyrinomonadaceae bacterium]|jgi:carbamoyltransferase|nr:SGNH/GDSL hydrolase family protein [Pyrinomonadaceae bacterium]